jgi:hypothetical protein
MRGCNPGHLDLGQTGRARTRRAYRLALAAKDDRQRLRNGVHLERRFADLWKGSTASCAMALRNQTLLFGLDYARQPIAT